MTKATDEEIRMLVAELDLGRDAWIHGHLEKVGTSRMAQAADMTIFGPFGGKAVRNGPEFGSRQSQVAARFRGGSGTTEIVEAFTSGDLLVLVLVERSQVLFEGREEPQSWVLRTTQVFRREGDGWLRLHRHADPLIKFRSFEETLALAADTGAG